MTRLHGVLAGRNGVLRSQNGVMRLENGVSDSLNNALCVRNDVSTSWNGVLGRWNNVLANQNGVTVTLNGVLADQNGISAIQNVVLFVRRTDLSVLLRYQMTRFASRFPALSILGAFVCVARADQADDLVKVMARRFADVEGQLDRSVHYQKKTASGSDTKTEQAWFNGSGELIKIAVEQAGPQSRDLEEYFPDEFHTGDRAMFMFTRKERPTPDGGTQIDEVRSYYGSGTVGNRSASFLLRQLTKSGTFKPGESLDTVRIRNVTRKLYQPPPNEDETEKFSQEASAMLDKPQEIADAMTEAGPPDRDPTSGISGDSEKYRVIRGTASPDGRYAVALSFSSASEGWPARWNLYAEATDTETYFVEAGIMGDGAEDIINVVVDLQTRRILGPTGCFYMGTRQRYNHRECAVIWSPDSSTFVELFSDKWSYVNCMAGRIVAGPKLLDPVDVGEAAGKNVTAYFKRHKGADTDDDDGLDLSVGQVTNDGTIDLGASSYFRSGDRKGDFRFELNQQLRLRATGKGLRLETLDVRKSRKE